MLDKPGVRVEKVAVRVVRHGQACVIGNVIGFVAKIEQLGRFVDPSSVAATQDVDVGELCMIFVGGEHDLALEAAGPNGNTSAFAVGNRIYMDPATDDLFAASAVGRIPLGVVTELDATRDPDVVKVNTNLWQPFIVG